MEFVDFIVNNFKRSNDLSMMKLAEELQSNSSVNDEYLIDLMECEKSPIALYKVYEIWQEKKRKIEF